MGTQVGTNPTYSVMQEDFPLLLLLASDMYPMSAPGFSVYFVLLQYIFRVMDIERIVICKRWFSQNFFE